MSWIVGLWEIILATKFVMFSFSAIFFLFVALHILLRLKEKEFMNKVNKYLRILLYLFSVYILFSLIIIGVIKDYVLYPFDFIFYTQLCGAIMLLFLFISNITFRYSGLKTTLLGIPIVFFGGLAGCFLLVYLPNSIFYGTKFGIGHAPVEFFGIDLLLLMAYSLFIGVKNLFIKIRGLK